MEGQTQQTLLWSDWVGIYGAVIATIIGLLEIVRFIKENKNRLVLKYWIGTRVTPIAGALEQWARTINIKVTNHSAMDKFIQQPGFQSNVKDSEGNDVFIFVDPERPMKYPVKLAPGEVFQLSYNVAPFKENLNRVGRSKTRAFVKDTFGNTYYSKWLKYDEIP